MRGEGASEQRRVAEALLTSLCDVPAGRLPARLCEVGVDLLPVTGASISLMAEPAVRQMLCASDRVAARLTETQFTIGDAPSAHAFSTRAPVLAADLRGGADARRWPVFAQQALALGVEAVFCLPLTIGAITTGTLDLYRDAAGPLSEPEAGVALLVADAVTLSVLRLYAGRGEAEYEMAEDEAGWREGEFAHDQVHRATGMVMVQLDVGADEALLRLRARAFATDMTLAELAREVVERRARFDPHD